jgi:hypothetical protein
MVYGEARIKRLRAYEEARKKLASFSKLETDWDTYGAPPISPMCIARVGEILDILERGGEEEAPTPVPTNDGMIALEWHSNGRDEEWEIFIESADR